MTGRPPRPGFLAVCVLSAIAPVGGAADISRGTPFDPSRVPWTSVEFEASKFFITATAGIQVTPRAIGEVAGQLASTPTGKPVEPEASVLELHYRASGVGRDADMALWLNPRSGAALQYRQVLGGGRSRLRIVRFADIGIFERSRRPAKQEEESLAPEQWSNRAEEPSAYPPAARGEAVIEPISLLWLVSAAELRKPGDRMAVLAFSRHDVYRVTAEVTGSGKTRVDYRERRAGIDKTRQGAVRALHIHIRGINIEPNKEDDFELLGLRGEMSLLLDPVTRVPLELSGSAKIVGQIAMQLRAATIEGNP